MSRLRSITGTMGMTIAWLIAGCQHAPPVSLPEGKSAFKFLEPLAATPPPPIGGGAGPRQPVDVFVQADPVLPLAPPVYPKAALTAQAGAATVGVRITVDGNGRVADVGASLVCFSTPGPHAAEFRAAVETALAQWTFVPAEIRHLVPMRGLKQNEYWSVTRVDKTDTTFDVAFTFTADGGVVTGLPGGR